MTSDQSNDLQGEDVAREVDCRTDLKTTKGKGVVTSLQHITPQFGSSQTFFFLFLHHPPSVPSFPAAP